MQLHLRILALLLVFTAPVYAQNPTQNLPELEEWYSWPGAKNARISYLPNFDTANGGRNAITQMRDGDPTWYNQYPYDTTNHFSWHGGSFSVIQLDFNGDGIADYIDGEGRVYKGVVKNAPPVLVDSVIYDRGGGAVPTVGDFNNDGYDDMLTVGSNGEITFILGGTNLLRLRRKVITLPTSSTLHEWFGVGGYISEPGKGRFIAYQSDNSAEAFILYGLTFKASTGDSVIVGTTMLDRIIESRQKPSESIISDGCLYENKKAKEYTLLVSYMPPNVRTMPFAILNDKFSATSAMKISTTDKYCLSGSIDGDDEPDWINRDSPHTIYSGNPAKDRTARAKIPIGKCSTRGYYCFVGDVTGDGIGDLAFGQWPGAGDCFSIYKGIDWRKLSASDFPTTPDFTLHQSEPSPIGKDGMAVLPITLVRAGVYTLDVYDLTGKRIGELFHGELPSGEVRLPFDVKLFNLSSGMFALRLTDGKHTRERAIVIQR